jgi:hypothetical protein
MRSIMSLVAKRDKRFGCRGHTKTVGELPDEVRGGDAIPAVISELVRQMDEGRSLQELQKLCLVDIGSWNIELG